MSTKTHFIRTLVILAGLLAGSFVFPLPLKAATQDKILFNEGNRAMVMANLDGSDRQQLGQGNLPRFSPDGTKIVFSEVGERCATLPLSTVALYTQNLDGTNRVQLTHEYCTHNKTPVWSPDGTQIAFTHQLPGQIPDLHIMNADGSNNHLVLTDASNPTWSPDGSRIAFITNHATMSRLGVANADGTDRTMLPDFTFWGHDWPTWSPDGTRLAFTGGGGGMLHTVHPDGTNHQVIVPANAGGPFGVWSPDSTKLLFNGANNLQGLNIVNSMGGTPTNLGWSGIVSDWKALSAPRQLVAAGPFDVWLGLPSPASAGIRFDVQVQVFVDDILATSGVLESINPGLGLFGFSSAKNAVVPIDTFAPVNVPPGSTLKVTLAVRNACSGSHRNAGMARLWFNDAQASSHLAATQIGESTQNYYLADAFALNTAVGQGPKQTIDVSVGAKCGAYVPFGTWTVQP